MSTHPIFLVQARLVRHETPDGVLSIPPGRKVGDQVLVDLYSRHRLPYVDGRGQCGVAEFVQCAEDGELLPFLCLELES